MKTRITTFKTATLALLGSLAVLVFAAVPAQSKQDRVEICHKGALITVAGPAVAAHFGHGDNFPDSESGLCEIPLPDPDLPPL